MSRGICILGEGELRSNKGLASICCSGYDLSLLDEDQIVLDKGYMLTTQNNLIYVAREVLGLRLV